MFVIFCMLPLDPVNSAEPPRKLDPAAWGADHVGQAFPEYITGDECLFCHRRIGTSWGQNRHTQTLRPVDPESKLLKRVPPQIAAEVTHVLGNERVSRLLKKSPAYGKLDMLTTRFAAEPSAKRVTEGPVPSNHVPKWEAHAFGDQCAGCHATAVESETRSFSALAIDCVACHGVVELAHTKDANWALLSPHNREPRQVISICGQCHLRGGKSKSTSLPYPNTFVPGDNLLRDFQVDLSPQAIVQMNPVDRHVFESARSVVVLGKNSQDCLACHEVHPSSTQKHQSLEVTEACQTCHVSDTDQAELKPSYLNSVSPKGHSRTCAY